VTSALLPDQRLVEFPLGRVVDVLCAGLAELGLPQSADEALVLPRQALGVDQRPEALIEAELDDLGIALLLRVAGSHRIESQSWELP